MYVVNSKLLYHPISIRDVNMKQICPNCKKIYKTELDRNKFGKLPNGTATQREQLISGICSDKCWNEFLGI